MTTPNELYQKFFVRAEKVVEMMRQKAIVVFHCEFSTQRGPQMMNLMRETDRKINDDRYPSLIYPEIYLLEHGYRNFYKAYTVSLLTLRITANLETT